VDPASPRLEAHDLDAVYLVTEGDSLEAGHGPAKCEPPAHHLAYRLVTPEAKIEATAGLGPTASDTGDHSVFLSPPRDFESGHWPWNADLADL
jgi:hypothetical protein